MYLAHSEKSLSQLQDEDTLQSQVIEKPSPFTKFDKYQKAGLDELVAKKQPLLSSMKQQLLFRSSKILEFVKKFKQAGVMRTRRWARSSAC